MHEPVLLAESLATLAVAPGRDFVDGTLGDGGHAEAILQRTAPGGRLLGLDRDPDALRIAGERLAPFGDRATLAHASFRQLAEVLREHDLERVDGVLLDLGVSSRQLDESARGFRFGADTADETPLDMRMDTSDGPTAAQYLARASEPELAHWFADFGELPGSHKLARAIVAAREREPLETTADLRRVIAGAGIGRGRRHDPATLVFQALRIAVNDELGALDEGLEAALEALAPGGRLCVLAYHSLEDRRVKRYFAAEERGCVCPPRIPVCVCGRTPRLRRITKRPLGASDDEIARNPRARSVRLRGAERLAEAA